MFKHRPKKKTSNEQYFETFEKKYLSFNSTMKPLVTIQRMLTWLNVCPSPSDDNQRKRITFTFCVILSTILTFASSLAIFLTYLRIDLEKSLSILQQLTGSSTMLNAIVVTFFLRTKITNTLDKLAEIYNACKQKL